MDKDLLTDEEYVGAINFFHHTRDTGQNRNFSQDLLAPQASGKSASQNQNQDGPLSRTYSVIQTFRSKPEVKSSDQKNHQTLLP
jgi:hypothetical protein